MKERGTPISLFSFQDIVTSLTGVMVIIILVIVLQLVEAVYDYENPKSDNPEYLALKGKIQELEGRVQQLKETGEEIPEEFKVFLQISEDEIGNELSQAQDAKAMLSSEKERNAEDIKKISLSMEQIKELLRASKAEKEKAEAAREAADKKLQNSKEDPGIIEMERRLQSLQLENERLRNQIRISAEKVEFSFKGIMSRQPILVECLGTGFRAQVYKSGEGVRNFTGGDFESNLSNLISWLRTKDMMRSYPVLLLRKESFSKIDRIEEELYKMDGIRIGKEPLNDKVKVF